MSLPSDVQAAEASVIQEAAEPGPRRRRRPDSARIRERLVAAAVEVFGEKGYSATTLETIAEMVGLTRQGVLRRFPSKEALFAEVIADQARWARAQYSLGDAGQEPSGDSPPEGGLWGLRALVPTADSAAVPRHRLTMAQVLQGEAMSGAGAAREYSVHRMAGAREQIATRLERAREAGEVAGEVASAADTTALASLLSAAINGLQAQWLLDGSSQPGEAFDLLLAMITRSGNRPG